MVLYLLDANVLIDANRDYYPIERVPEYWSWLEERGRQNKVKIPEKMYAEVIAGSKDKLTVWAKLQRVKDSLLLDEQVDSALVWKTLTAGYAPDLDEVDIEKIGKDPF